MQPVTGTSTYAAHGRERSLAARNYHLREVYCLRWMFSNLLTNSVTNGSSFSEQKYLEQYELNMTRLKSAGLLKNLDKFS